MSGASTPPQRLVILGGGYVGIDAYRSVMRRAGALVRSGRLRVTVVNNTRYHTFHGFTGEVLGQVLPLERTLTPLAPLLPAASVLVGQALRADLEGQTVDVQHPDGRVQRLRYDHLILGTGSRDPLERLPGLREHGWRLKDTRDMQAFLARLDERFGAGVPATLAVIGGGPAGVEMAAALRERQRRSGVGGEVHLLCGGGLLDSLRAQFPGLARHALASLRRAEVQVHHTRAVGVQAGGVTLPGGELLPADEVLYTAGIALTTLPGTESLPRDPAGRLLTDEFLRVQGQANIWAGGDAARVKHPAAPGDCPTNALWAMKHGMWAGSNVAHCVLGRPLCRFTYRGLGQAAGLGLGDGVADLLGVPLRGPLAWALRLGFFVWYMPSKRQGVLTLRDLLRLSRTPRLIRQAVPLIAGD